MFLITAATQLELDAYLRASPASAHLHLVTGVGLVESAVRLTAYLASNTAPIQAVINLGVAGAYIQAPQEAGAGLLDICLAEREVLGDLGIWSGNEVQAFQRNEVVSLQDSFELDAELLHQAASILDAAAIAYRRGIFVTVQGVSGTRQRGEMLARRHRGLCENMEGAAVARVCQHFGLSFLELRCISNLVEDAEQQGWCLKEACARCGEVAALIVQGLSHV